MEFTNVLQLSVKALWPKVRSFVTKLKVKQLQEVKNHFQDYKEGHFPEKDFFYIVRPFLHLSHLLTGSEHSAPREAWRVDNGSLS